MRYAIALLHYEEKHSTPLVFPQPLKSGAVRLAVAPVSGDRPAHPLQMFVYREDERGRELLCIVKTFPVLQFPPMITADLLLKPGRYAILLRPVIADERVLFDEETSTPTIRLEVI